MCGNWLASSPSYMIDSRMFSSFGIVGFASNNGRKSGKYYVICHNDAGVIMSNLYLIYNCTMSMIKHLQCIEEPVLFFLFSILWRKLAYELYLRFFFPSFCFHVSCKHPIWDVALNGNWFIGLVPNNKFLSIVYLLTYCSQEWKSGKPDSKLLFFFWQYFFK